MIYHIDQVTSQTEKMQLSDSPAPAAAKRLENESSQTPPSLARIPGLSLLHAEMKQETPQSDTPSSSVDEMKTSEESASNQTNGQPKASSETASTVNVLSSIRKTERSAPSRLSGGVPEPTCDYIAQSLMPAVTLPSPRRILVILDLNGTVLYRPAHFRPSSFVQRPYAHRFLSYCLDTFCLAIWSSARPENVERMVGQLLTPEQRSRCVVAWGRDRLGLCARDYAARVQCYKRLSTAWEDPVVQASHPYAAHGFKWDQTNTVLVDDSREKGRSEPYNILAVPEFSGPENEDSIVLPQVHDYLNTLCYQEDISCYMRRNPFQLSSDYILTP
ncbi:hypothetical protein L249_4518 [Ophiocordyceps polyrhachis-furcata BCC 54312]|uniref:Mitochondrial import inner membrane translocase subunit TIM50 n=1 Tax=Ophiocordyceps polyrhachis-furcata BCC 54312 TaxID=1330021 RepID=A0A367KZ76_9HYPO|nr:hypothetical protein L249_4518 [Ophiocordyceps polyrhachis-furcata BCC 54312]